jgi:tRNA(fMet)-specific endonuclease VapC
LSRFLLDTNILSEPTYSTPHPQVLAKLAEHRQEVATAAVIWHELWYGCRRLPPSRKQQRIEAYLLALLSTDLPILPYTQQAADWHAKERTRLTILGKTPTFADGQIAAIAYVHDLILVTRNQSDFANFEKLLIENWFADEPAK